MYKELLRESSGQSPWIPEGNRITNENTDLVSHGQESLSRAVTSVSFGCRYLLSPKSGALKKGALLGWGRDVRRLFIWVREKRQEKKLESIKFALERNNNTDHQIKAK